MDLPTPSVVVHIFHLAIEWVLAAHWVISSKIFLEECDLL
jgi:hypothetical protein